MVSLFERDLVTVNVERAGRHPPRHGQRRVTVDREALHLDAELVPREQLIQLWTVLGERAEVHVQAADGTKYSMAFTEPNVAAQLVEALGRRPERGRIEILLEPSLTAPGLRPLPMWQVALTTLASLVLMIVAFPFLLRPPVSGGALNVARWFARTLKLEADRLQVHYFGRHEELRYRDVVDVRRSDDAVVLQVADGREIELRAQHAEHAIAIAQRIEQARAEQWPTESDVDRLPSPAALGAEQQAALQQLAGDDASYRAGVPRERLADVAASWQADAIAADERAAEELEAAEDEAAEAELATSSRREHGLG